MMRSPIWVFVVPPPVLMLVGAQALRGVGVGPINPIATTVLQEPIPREVLGRVFGLLIASARITFPLSNLVTGYLVEGVSLIPPLVAFSMLLIPAFHKMDIEQTSLLSAEASPE